LIGNKRCWKRRLISPFLTFCLEHSRLSLIDIRSAVTSRREIISIFSTRLGRFPRIRSANSGNRRVIGTLGRRRAWLDLPICSSYTWSWLNSPLKDTIVDAIAQWITQYVFCYTLTFIHLTLGGLPRDCLRDASCPEQNCTGILNLSADKSTNDFESPSSPKSAEN